MKSWIAVGGLLLASSCSTVQQVAKRIDTVNPASLAAEPQRWNGREIEVVGLLVWDGTNQWLYQSYGTYCRGAERAAIRVDWPRWPAVAAKDNRRQIAVRGTFRTLTSDAAPIAIAPGVLDPGYVLRWLSEPQPACPNKIGQ